MSARTAAQIARSQRKAAKKRERQIAALSASPDPACIECGRIASKVFGDVIYPHRPEFHHRVIWRCACGAYVGCHPGTHVALGRPAGPATRRARNAAHQAFDPLWLAKARKYNMSRSAARNMGYIWLAMLMGMTRDECHIGLMTAEQALKVVEICRRYSR